GLGLFKHSLDRWSVRFSCATVLRRLSACLAAGAGAFLVLAAATTPAKSGPAGGYAGDQGPRHGGPPRDLYNTAQTIGPSEWLSYSGHTFQRLMRMLAERSAGQASEPEVPSALAGPEPAAPAGPGTLPW